MQAQIKVEAGPDPAHGGVEPSNTNRAKKTETTVDAPTMSGNRRELEM